MKEKNSPERLSNLDQKKILKLKIIVDLMILMPGTPQICIDMY